MTSPAHDKEFCPNCSRHEADQSKCCEEISRANKEIEEFKELLFGEQARGNKLNSRNRELEKELLHQTTFAQECKKLCAEAVGKASELRENAEDYERRLWNLIRASEEALKQRILGHPQVECGTMECFEEALADAKKDVS